MTVEEVMTRWREFRRSEPGFRQYVLGNQVHGTRVELHSGDEGGRGEARGGPYRRAQTERWRGGGRGVAGRVAQ